MSSSEDRSDSEAGGHLEDIKNLYKEVQALTKQIAQIQVDNKRCTQENERLQQENIRLRNENSEIRREIERLKKPSSSGCCCTHLFRCIFGKNRDSREEQDEADYYHRMETERQQ